MFSKILVIWQQGESNQRLMQRAALFANSAKAEVTLATFVVPEGDGEEGSVNVSFLNKDLQQAASTHFTEASEVNPLVLTCTDFEQAVVDHQSSQQYDLIIKSKSGSGDFLESSEDWHIAREVNCAVMLVSARKRKTKPVLLATIDIDESSEQQEQMNEGVLNWAACLAGHSDCKIHVSYTIPMSKATLELDIFEPEEILRDKGQQAQQRLIEVTQNHGVPSARLHVSAGDIAKNVKGAVSKLHPELVIVGSVGRKGIKGLLLGNTAEKILEKTNCDVLIVRPVAS